MICSICNKEVIIGKVDDKIVACCENNKCQSVLIFGDPIQKALREIEKKK